jgi:malonyl-CoA O-methyltransferase
MNNNPLRKKLSSVLPVLNRVDYPATSQVRAARPLVLLHGWGGDSSTFTGLIKALTKKRPIITLDLPGFGGSEQWLDFESSEQSVETLLAAIAQQLPEQFDLLGWSLGGMLAVQFCHQYHTRVRHLITLASNAVFAEVDDWPAAMPKQTYEEFCGYFSAQPMACLKQFCGLQAQGDSDRGRLFKTLRGQLPQRTNSNWLAALKLLGLLDNRDALRQIDIPVLHLLGAQDQLVPCSAATMLSQLNKAHHVEVLPEVAHPLHLSAVRQVTAYVEQFLDQEGYQLAKRKVADSFSKAAKSYDSVAHLQRYVGDKLLARCAEILPLCGKIDRVIDVGCGTGYLISHLKTILPAAEIVAMDIASGMLAFARSQQPDIASWLCADAELLPLSDNSADLLISNLAYQWCQHPLRWGAELKRTLRADGVALLSTLGPDTLFELRAAWSEVDGYVHVNEFMPLDDLIQALQQCGLTCDVVVERECLRYSQLNHLMRELKELGAHNINAGQNAALTGRQRIKQLNQAYEQFRNHDGLLPATYDVAYLLIRKGSSL